MASNVSSRTWRAINDSRRNRELASTRRAAAHARRQVRREQLLWVQRASGFLFSTLAFCVVAVVIAVVVLPDWLAPYVVGAEMTSFGWWIYLVMLKTAGLAGRVSGIDAEQWTIDELIRLTSRGWRLINHVMLEYVDVDHVLIGPGGLFAVETKFRSNWQYSKSEFPAIAKQALASARDPRLRVGSSTPFDPLVIIWGPNVKRDFEQPFEVDGVTFCPGHLLITFAKELPARIDADTIRSAYTGLDNYIRKRDAGEQTKHGPVPRPISDHLNDLVAALVATMATAIAIALPINLRPTAVWSVASAAVAATVSLMTRNRLQHRVRWRTITTGTATVSIGIAAILGAVLLVDNLSV